MTSKKIRAALQRGGARIDETRTPAPPIERTVFFFAEGVTTIDHVTAVSVNPERAVRFHTIRVRGPRDVLATCRIQGIFVGQCNLLPIAPSEEGVDFTSSSWPDGQELSFVIDTDLYPEFCPEDHLQPAFTILLRCAWAAPPDLHVASIGLTVVLESDLYDDDLSRVTQAVRILSDMQRLRAQLDDLGAKTLALLDVAIEHREPGLLCARCSIELQVTEAAPEDEHTPTRDEALYIG